MTKTNCKNFEMNFEVNENSSTVMVQSRCGNHKLVVYKFGATITSWVCAGQEKLFLSTQAIFDGSKAIRGGIPLVFPQFSQPNKAMPQHGVARTAHWTFKSFATTANSATTVLVLSSNESTLAVWPHAFYLEFEIILTATSLDIALTAFNTGSAPFNCQMLLHTYLRVPHIDSTTVHGYHGKQYIDKLDQETVKTEENHGIVIDREVDRIYDFNGEEVHIDVKSNDASVVKVTSTASASTGQATHPDCVLWNAWIEKSRSLADLNDDAYLSYVCVEPGLVIKPVEIAPNQSVTLRQLLDA